MVEKLEAAEDGIGEISIEDTTKCIPDAARTVEFETVGGRNQLVKKSKEHIEAEKILRVKIGKELTAAKRKLAKQRRKYKARRVIQTMHFTKNKNEGCHSLLCHADGRGTRDRQKMG